MRKKGIIFLLVLTLLSTGSFARTAEAQTIAEDTQKSNSTVAPSGIAKDKNGSMYIADRSYHVIRRRSKSGTYTILAGQEGKSGYKDGSAEKALFSSPWDIVSYKKGWAVSDTENHVIRYCKGGKVTTLAGSGKKSYKFQRPTGLAVGKNGELYIADTGKHVIYKRDKNGKVTVYAGSKKGCADGKVKKARFYEPTGLYYYKGALYVADSGNHRICKIKDGKVTTVAGSTKGVEGDAVGSAKKARFSNPQEIILYKDVMYIADTGNGSVKKLSKGKVTRLIGEFSMEDGRGPAEPCGLMIQGGNLYVGDIFLEELLEKLLTNVDILLE